MKETLDFILDGGNVRRYHTRYTITSQNNAEHSYGVASIVALIAPDCSKELLLHALWHDVPECLTGDIPGPAKTEYPELKKILTKIEEGIEKQYPIFPKISKEETAILKMADCLETILFCQKEHAMGNNKLATVIESCKNKFLQMHLNYPNKTAAELFKSITKEN
jgi:5'-deoxynucleotidase YfbR-like HD superfamily hydrolase